MMLCKRLRRLYAIAIIGIAVALAGCGSVEPTERTAVNVGPPQAAGTLNINTATEVELTTLPGIGEGLAKRIIDHRNEHGAFRKAEHIMMVEGISDTRYRRIRDLITTH